MRSRSSLTLGVDLGGSKVAVALVDDSGRILEAHRQPTGAHRSAEAVISDVVECVKECLAAAPVVPLALGLGVAGQVDRATGAVRQAQNLAWSDVPLRAEIEGALGLPVAVLNDVRAAAWGEWLYGAGRGVSDFICVFVGTGIGGGVVSGGRVLEGDNYSAAEIGHITIAVDGRPCRCGGFGCLEAYAGGWAIAERAQEEAARDALASQALVTIAGSVEAITADTISRAFQQGEPFAERFVAETGRYLAAGIVSIVNAFNPALVILGGGVMEGLPSLLPDVEKIVRQRALPASVERLRFSVPALGNEAGVIGAAAYARTYILMEEKA